MLARLFRWAFPIFQRNWITLAILSTMVSVIAYSLDEANWVRNDAPLVNGLIAAVIFGWLLSISRFRGWFVFIYAAFISTVISLEGVANVIPTPDMLFGASFFQLVNQMNLRAWEFYLRVTGWIETLQNGENIRDTGIFVLLLTLILAVCGTWLMWAMIRQRRAINGLLPLALLFAVNVNLSRQPLGNYMVFLLCALLLVARTAFNRQHEEWNSRHVDYPDQLGLEWGLSSLALAVVIILAARAAPFLGTQEGWRALSDWYEKTRVKTSDVGTRLFSGVNPPPLEPTKKPEIYVNVPNMANIGDPVSQGNDTIMWVTISDPAPIPPEIGMNIPSIVYYIHYWRNGIYSTYTGKGWQPAPMTGDLTQQTEKLPEKPPPGRYYLHQHFEINAIHTGALFSVNDPEQADSGVSLRSSNVDSSHVLEGKASSYDVVSAVTKVTANQLASAPTDYPTAIRRAYLQLPDELPSRVRTLAMHLTDGINDPYHKAIQIQNYLRDNFPYDLAAQPTPPNRDVVDYFLFDSTRGFCTHYATAMTVMLRAVGVPARVATGYAMGEWVQERQSFRVPVSAAHAWVEVYFNGYGWVEFEPTAYRDPIVYRDEGSKDAGSTALTANRSKNKPLTPAFTALVAAAALALLALPFLLLRMFFPPKQSPVKQASALYKNMRRALSWAGLPALASVTPDEYLMLYGEQLVPYKRLSTALLQATAVYREIIYSPRPPDERRIRIASQLWQQSFRDWLMLWTRATWRRMRAKKAE